MVLRHQHCLRWLTSARSSTWPSVVTRTPDINPDPGCSRDKDPDMALASNPGLDNTMALGASTPTQIMMFLVAEWLSDTLMAVGGSSDPGCGRSTDPNMFLGSSLDSDVTMILGGSPGYLDQHGFCGSMALGHEHGPRWWPRPHATPLHSSQPQEEPQASTQPPSAAPGPQSKTGTLVIAQAWTSPWIQVAN